jgi:cyclopropane fatty-acyl-phospholipid synthase-like methyltransferase
MSHLKYYAFQTTARDVQTFGDIERTCAQNAHIYDRIVLPWIAPLRSGRLAELACGHGAFLLWLKQRSFENVQGVDSSEAQVAFAIQTGCVVSHSDVNAWLNNEAEKSLDAIIAIDLVEHLAKDSFVELLERSQRALAPGGKLILRLPNGDSPLVGLNLFNDITHVWTYTSTCLRSLAQMTGFAHTRFSDESTLAIRDHRWIKVPLARISQHILGCLFRAAARHPIRSWSPHLWACLQR